MKLLSIAHDPTSGNVVYDFLVNGEVRRYRANALDQRGIRRIECAPDLEVLLLDALTRNVDAVKMLSRVTWDLFDGGDIELPIEF